MNIDPKTIKRKEFKPEELKRDNWTNEEVLHLLKDMEYMYSPDGEEKEIHSCYTDAINEVRDIFESFQAPEDSYCGPMAYDKKSGFTVYIGPPLPVC
jgi:hypothetical protein